MPLDVAAQGEEQGLEPCPDPKRSFLTYRLTLDRKCEKKNSVIICCHTSVEAKLKLEAVSSGDLVAFASSFRGKIKKQFRNTIKVVHATQHVETSSFSW